MLDGELIPFPLNLDPFVEKLSVSLFERLRASQIFIFRIWAEKNLLSVESEAQWSKFSGSQLEKERSSECPVWALWNRWILQRPSQQYTCWLYPLVLYCIECDVCYFWCCTSQMSMENRSLNTFDIFASVAFPSVLYHVIHALVW